MNCLTKVLPQLTQGRNKIWNRHDLAQIVQLLKLWKSSIWVPKNMILDFPLKTYRSAGMGLGAWVTPCITPLGQMALVVAR